MLVSDIIRRKRDGKELSEEQIEFFARGLADDSIPAEQVSALAMAIYLNSMSPGEAATLTRAMASSGRILDWAGEGLDGPVIDKHSTGGVGDKVSLVLAPIAAACGCRVPMVSGRGLGHTGGTLDKIACVPGYLATPDLGRLRRALREAGCAIIGQTAELAPADRRFYAIRDITATVESIPLVTASILSKKIAAGLDALVMDVKVGNGAFMKTLADARSLADSLVRTAAGAGLPVRALITDMNEPLGATVGNALEVDEAMAYLRNEVREPRLDAVVLALAAEMLVIGGLETDRGRARARADDAITSGAAALCFDRMCAALGGPTDFVERCREYLPAAPVTEPVMPEREGWLGGVDAFAVGQAVIALGGGRRRRDDALDLSVGFSATRPVGSRVDRQTPLALVHAASAESAAEAGAALRRACLLANEPPQPPPLIYETAGGKTGPGE